MQTPLLQLSARVSDYHFIVAMSLLDSKSAFDSRAQQVGLVEEVVQALSDKGIASLAQLGFAAGTPGTTDETSRYHSARKLRFGACFSLHIP